MVDQVVFLVLPKEGLEFDGRFSRRKPLEGNFVRQAQL